MQLSSLACGLGVALLMTTTSGCAAAPHSAGLTRVPVPSAPTVPDASGLEDATAEVKIYEHDSVAPESTMPTVGGYVRVEAPLDVAFEMATRFGEYRDLLPSYIEQSTVVDKNPRAKTTDVYLKVPTVIHEYVWAVVRFKPVRTKIGFAYRGDEVEGNLDDLRIYWRIVPSGTATIAQFEFLADPHLPIPRAWILPELREGVRSILERYRDKTEAAAYGRTRVDESRAE